jgi:phospholipase C
MVERQAFCGLHSAFDFTKPDDAVMPKLPDTSNYAVLDAQQRTMLPYSVPPKNQPLFQESGTRFSRKLPYELHVNASVTPGISVVLTFANTGTQGAVYHVYDKLHLDRIPRRYTVEAGKTLTDSWDLSADLGKHELWVYGPNGFVRVFKDEGQSGADVASPECRVCYDIANGDVYVKFSNSGKQACTLTIQDSAYGSGGPWVLKVDPGNVVEQKWTLRKSGNWYDFSVTADTNKAYLRRFAGRVETGQHGLSDPALGTA